jgi:hypothetical protein
MGPSRLRPAVRRDGVSLDRLIAWRDAMAASDDIFSHYSRAYEGRKEVELSLLE